MLYKAIEEVKIVGQGNRTESDHMLIEVELTGMERKRGKKSDMRIKEKSVDGRRSDALSRKMKDGNAHKKRMDGYGRN